MSNVERENCENVETPEKHKLRENHLRIFIKYF